MTQPTTLTIEHAYAAIDLLDWCKTHRVPWNNLANQCLGNYLPEGDCEKVKVLLIEVDPSAVEGET
jgi:hypothetical protein